jgi:putative glycerol-1-phosphate prenyltransferase
MKVYDSIFTAYQNQQPLLAVLVDPEKTQPEQAVALCKQIKNTPVTHLLVGGSTFQGSHLEELVIQLKNESGLPVLLFPGDYAQITEAADGILFLSLLSGRNPEYLIEQQVKAAPLLNQSNLEILPTGYLLIDSGVETAVQRVSGTPPMPRDNTHAVAMTALAGQLLGKKLIYLEAGSGAQQPVPLEMITAVTQILKIPTIVGGGIRSWSQIQAAYQAGATLVVIGTAFEENPEFFINS